MDLRPYQITGKLLLSELFQSGYQSVIGCSPTGSGKTVLFADIARDAVLNGARVMVLCNRKELIKQAKNKLNKYQLYPTIIDPDYRDKESNLYLASVDTLRNRKFPEIDLLIVDECHIRSFDPIVLKYISRGTNVIGCTATPERTGKAEIEDLPNYTGQLWEVYQAMIVITTTTELLEQGYIVHGIPAEPSRATSPEITVKVTNTKDGLEFNRADMFKKFDKPELYAGVVDNYLKFAKGKRAICFNIDVKHSKLTCEEFNRRGIPSAHVDANSKDRDKIFADFESGKILVLHNVAIATTGYDNPLIECIIVNRMIYSLTLWLQILGRGGRPCEEINKNHFIYIDQGGNIIRHGRYEDEREWSIDPVVCSKKRGIAPTRQCESCECIISAAAVTCPYCNIMQSVKAMEATELATAEFEISEKTEAALRKPIAKMTIPELEKYRTHKKYQPGWIVRQLFARGSKALQEYANYKNYAKSWVDVQINLAANHKETIKDQLWKFITTNKHLSDDQVIDFANKKLKGNFSPDEIIEMIPNIIISLQRFKDDEIDIDGNEILQLNDK